MWGITKYVSHNVGQTLKEKKKETRKTQSIYYPIVVRFDSLCKNRLKKNLHAEDKDIHICFPAETIKDNPEVEKYGCEIKCKANN